MARFHPLTVTHIHHTTRDAVALTLQPQTPETFTFRHGQYLTFRRDFEGTEVRRSYSICSGLDDGALQVGIKRVDGGVFSSWANTDLKVGDVLDAMPPAGAFTSQLAPDQARHYLCVAGGSGITPILSILRTLADKEPLARITLIYANRNMRAIMFREEIEDLKNRLMQRLNMVHILEHDAQDIDLFTGRLDADKCDRLFSAWIDPRGCDLAFLCGPAPMMEIMSAALVRNGMAQGVIKTERFSGDQPGRVARPAMPAAALSDQKVTALVTLDGTTQEVALDPSLSVLDAVRAAGLDAPYACKAGVCSTCKARLTAGEVEMVANHALEDYEVAAGFVLTCQSYCQQGPLALDYDQH